MALYDSNRFKNLHQKLHNQYLFAYIIAGMTLMAILYAVVMLVSLKEPLYGYYALFEFGLLLYLMVHIGLFGSYGNPKLIWSINALSLFLSILFSLKFLNNYRLDRILKYILMFGLIVNLIYIILFASGVFVPFYGSAFVLFIVLAALMGEKNKEMFLFLSAWIVILASVIVIEFYPTFMNQYLHPMFVALPIEAILMLGVIGLYLKRLNEQNRYIMHQTILLNKEKSLSKIAGALSHQYKTNLSKLSFNLMQLELNTKPKEDIIDSMQHHIGSLKTTTNEYLKLYGNNHSKKESKELKEILDLLLEYFDNITYTQIPTNTIVTYPWALKEILVILLDNTSKECNNTVSIEFKDSYLYICDSCGGIKDFKNIFEPKPSSGGSGIGLYIAKILSKKYFDNSLELYNHQDGVCAKIKIS
jgi:signal transduction histidine kinase